MNCEVQQKKRKKKCPKTMWMNSFAFRIETNADTNFTFPINKRTKRYVNERNE